MQYCRHWHELGYLILYLTARPDMQQRMVVSWLAQHNFPHGMVAFMDGLSAEPMRQKTNYLRHVVHEVHNILIITVTTSELGIHSFIHCSTWPAVGRCALHTTQSLAVSHAASAASPVSTSSCCIPDGEAGHVEVSTAACCRGGDQFLSGQPDAVPCGPEWLLEVVLRDETLHDVASWCCHEHFLG